MNSRTVALLVLVFAVAVGRPQPVPAATAGTRGKALRLRVLHVVDPMVGGGEAFRMLVPVGWQTKGGIEWRPERSNLATGNLRVWNPKGLEALEMFPNSPFTWMEGGLPAFPIGSIYLGNEVLPPITEPAAFVERVVVPRYRPGVGARVVSSRRMPELAAATLAKAREPGISKRVKAARVRLAYRLGSRPVEEDVYCVLVYSQSPMLPGGTLWSADQLFGFRAARGKLDALNGLLNAMISSIHVDLRWFSKYTEVVQLWQQRQMRAIRSAGELSRYIARTSDEISALVRQSYERQQAAQDRVHARFSRYLRGVESYRNPFQGRTVDLPSGYRDVWVSGRGEYLLSNQAGFDPNVGSTIEWRRMAPPR